MTRINGKIQSILCIMTFTNSRRFVPYETTTATFSRAMDVVLCTTELKLAFVVLDDVITFFRTSKSKMIFIKAALTLLVKAGIPLILEM